MEIRLSMGSATQLGLHEMRMDAPPTTLYAMLGDRCFGACTFCTQARDNTANRKLLSRIVWPVYNIDDVASRLVKEPSIKRICVQTLKDPALLDQLPPVIERLHAGNNKPISVCMNPVEYPYLIKLKHIGVERVGTGLDCATPESFSRFKPGFSWQQYQQFITETIDVFGQGSVHLIVGLGDRDEDLIHAFQRYTDMNCAIGLFALTPVRGTRLRYPPPPIERYRALQLARHLISTHQVHTNDMEFANGRLRTLRTSRTVIRQALSTGKPFQTSGCPNCNRPNYNERPGGIMYNFAQPMNERELAQAIAELQRYVTIIESDL
jgi:biotin synthase-related radical SAM superfamily protein